MGLDNGILVKSNKRKLTREMLPEGIKYPFENDYDGIEILYWRKNWGIRTEVMDTFNWRLAPEDEYRFDIDTPADVMTFIEIIASWLNEDRWETEGRSIWTYEEARPVLIQNIINLAMIHAFMTENPDIYLEFYDSY